MSKEIKHEIYKNAELLFEKGEFSDALQHLEQIEKKFCQYPEFYNLKGKVFWQMGMQAKAKQAFQKALYLDSAFWKACLNLGNMLREECQYIQSENFLLKADRLCPENELVLYSLGYLYNEIKHYQEAIFNFERLLKINPNHDDAKYCYSEALFQQEQYTKVIQILEDLLKAPLPCLVVSIHLKLAYAYKAISNDEETMNQVIALMEKGVILNDHTKEINEKKLSLTHYDLGNLYYVKGDFECAISSFIRCLDFYPLEKIRNVYFCIANSYVGMSRFADAEEYYFKALEIDGPSSLLEWEYVYTYLGCLFFNKKYTCLYKYIEPIYDSIHEDVKIKITYLLGMAYQRDKRLEKAISFYLYLIALDPKNTQSYCALGELYVSLDRWQEAVELVLSIINDIPLSRQLCNLASKLYENQGQRTLALEFRKKALDYTDL